MMHRRCRRNGKGIVHQVFHRVSTRTCVVASKSSACPSQFNHRVISLILRGRISVIIKSHLSSACFVRGGHTFRNFNGDLIHHLVDLLFGNGVGSVVANCQTFDCRFIGDFPILSRNFRVRARVSVRTVSGGLRLTGIIVSCHSHPRNDRSGLGALSSNFGMLGAVLQLCHGCGPLDFCSLLSLLLTLLDANFLVPILIACFHAKLMPRFPALVIYNFICVATVVTFFSNVVLSSVMRGGQRSFRGALLHIRGACGTLYTARGSLIRDKQRERLP